MIGDSAKSVLVHYPTSSAGVGGAAVLIDTADIAAGAVTATYLDSASSTTVTSTGASNVVSVSPTEAGVYEITVTGRRARTGGAGSDQLIAILSNTSGTGSFSGPYASTWNTNSGVAETTLAMSLLFTTSGSGPWTISLSFITGGGLATFSVADLSLRVTVIRK